VLFFVFFFLECQLSVAIVVHVKAGGRGSEQPFWCSQWCNGHTTGHNPLLTLH